MRLVRKADLKFVGVVTEFSQSSIGISTILVHLHNCFYISYNCIACAEGRWHSFRDQKELTMRSCVGQTRTFLNVCGGHQSYKDILI